jgi:hypothetical protein
MFHGVKYIFLTDLGSTLISTAFLLLLPGLFYLRKFEQNVLPHRSFTQLLLTVFRSVLK